MPEAYRHLPATEAIRAMRAGKDVMLDKPGAVNLAQCAELERVAAENKIHFDDPVMLELLKENHKCCIQRNLLI